uniref:Ubiquitin-like protease family profile domain-containing protein n=1 Tax=Leersia perrieri TaxID=77586 RepID=A0A0D9XXX7_9ORYZ
MAGARLTRAQIMVGATISVAEAEPKPTYVLGELFLSADKLKTIGIQMHLFHEWYMKASADEIQIGAKVRTIDYFTRQDDYAWIPFKDVFDMYQLDALDVFMLTAWVQMEIQRAIKNKNNEIAFMDPWQINTLIVKAQTHSVEDSLVHFLAQHHFKKWIFLSNYHDFHCVLFIFDMRHSVILVFDSMDKKAPFFTEINAIIDRAWDRFRQLIRGDFKEKLERIYKLKVEKQKMRTNLCGYSVCDYLHNLAPTEIFHDFRLIGFINEQILDPTGEFYMDD